MKEITILQLYDKDMNIYGDEGNVLVLKRRLEWYGYKPVVIRYNVGDTLPKSVDIVIGGGGQDSGQDVIHQDLLKIGPTLHDWADQGVPMLMVCGLYQLFGHSFETINNQLLKGIGVLDVKTIGKSERLIGNITTESSDFGAIIGYENHSGQTFLGPNAQPFARVQIGAGNNTEDDTEGARYKNVIGTYLHGSILPKNPAVADFIIQSAVTKKFGDFSHNLIDDSLAQEARHVAQKRPR
jgi:lipid II isoglutaminyl synthase (glutamine-hydrolysing)